MIANFAITCAHLHMHVEIYAHVHKPCDYNPNPLIINYFQQGIIYAHVHT